MTGRKRMVVALVGTAAAALGAGLLNFTKHWAIDHHRAWADAHGLPEPSHPLFLAGIALAILGGALLGFAVGRRGAGR